MTESKLRHLKLMVVILVPVLAAMAWADVDFNSLPNDSWVQQATGGEAPSRGGDVHCAIDKDGYLYMFGGCTYGNGAGGSHNADVYRVDLKTGIGDRITIASKPSSISCQRAQTYDSKRNVCYFDAEGGLIRFQCPNGPFTRVRDLPFSAQYRYLNYDPVNDLLIFSGDNGIQIYNIDQNTITGKGYPFGSSKITRWDIPCCFDKKRGLYVITLAAPYTVTDAQSQVIWDIHFYNPAIDQWHTKIPALTPQVYKGELAYDSKNDRYLYFGGSPSELWVYDYDTNTWTQVAQNGRSYNDADYTSSTWPPARHKHIWEYCEKYNVSVNWMGGQWANSAITDYDNGAQPLWMYRLSDQGASISIKWGSGGHGSNPLMVSPNPFNSAVTFRVNSTLNNANCKLQIFNINGTLVEKLNRINTNTITWNGADLSPGTYFIKLSTSTGTVTKSIMLVK